MNRADGLAPDQTDSVLIMLQVPRHWRRMSEDEIHRALKHNQPHLLPHLAETIKQWQGSGVLDLGKLRELLEEREAFDQEGLDG